MWQGSNPQWIGDKLVTTGPSPQSLRSPACHKSSVLPRDCKSHEGRWALLSVVFTGPTTTPNEEVLGEPLNQDKHQIHTTWFLLSLPALIWLSFSPFLCPFVISFLCSSLALQSASPMSLFLNPWMWWLPKLQHWALGLSLSTSSRSGLAYFSSINAPARERPPGPGPRPDSLLAPGIS